MANKVEQYINEHNENALQLLKTLVNINSQTEHIAGVRLVGMKLQAELDRLSFHSYWEQMPASMKRTGNLFSIRKGTQGKRLLLIGHLDTVFAADKQHQFKKINAHHAYGIGAADMKGGDVVIIQALKALQAAKQLENVTIAVAFIGDEESSGQPITASRRELMLLAKESDVVLDFESAPVSLGRRGISRWKLQTSGLQQHSSLIFQDSIGAGAVYELSRILARFDRHFSTVENLTVNPSLILGGSTVDFDGSHSKGAAAGKINVIAKKAQAIGDLRYISIQQREAIKKRMIDIVAHHLPQTQANIAFLDTIPPMPPTHANQALLDKLNIINGYLGGGKLVPLPPRLRGAGDISYIANEVKAGLVGMGVSGANEHALNESIDRASLAQASKRAALLIYALTHNY
jgi:glutamate carboxypeptidase